MKTIRQINIKNRQGYFFNDMANINYFDLNLLNIDEVLFKNDELVMYDIKYIKNLNNLNTLYLVFNNLDAYIEKSGENRYLIFASTEKNRIMLENYTELWREIKEQIELISGEKVSKYSKDFMKIKFKTNDDLQLNKIMNIPICVITVSSIFKEDGEYHPQILLHDCFYEYEEDVNLLVVY